LARVLQPARLMPAMSKSIAPAGLIVTFVRFAYT